MTEVDIEFLKTLTILFVDDDESIREEYLSIFNDTFKKVHVAIDGKDALDLFSDLKQKREDIDLIISDINMPNLNGIDFLTSIKEQDNTIPFIIITAHPNDNFLLEALKIGVSDYFMKPIDMDELLSKIQKVCQEKEKENELLSYEKEMKDYLEIINKVAVVYIFDKDGCLIYVNDFLKELIKCHEDELLEQYYTVMYHPEMSKGMLDAQWKSLQEGKKWQGKVKYITKNSSVFYTNSSIIPVKNKENGEINKFISVNFLTTKEENERREYKKKVLYNLQETKRVYKVAQEKINYLEGVLQHFKGYEKKEEFLNNLKKKNHEQYQELQKDERKIVGIRKRLEQLTFGVNSQINKIATATAEMKNFEEKASKKITKTQEEIKIREQFIIKIKEEIEEKSKKVKDLQDVKKHRQDQLVENNKKG